MASTNRKLWISESKFVDLDAQDGPALTEQIAVRSRSIEWLGLYGYLPDPDPVLRKTNQDLSVYRELLVDGRVWTCYQSRKAATLSCEWEIRESATNSKGASSRAMALVEEIMAGLDVYQVISDILEAPFYGASPLEVVWQSAPARWIPERIEGKPPEWFRFDPENRLRFLSRENMIEGELLPDFKFLLPRHHASYQNPYGERILSRCFWPVVFKKGGFKFWAIFTEKYGMPWVVGRVPRRTNETERAALLANLTSMVQDAVAVINDDETIEIKESAFKASSAGVYEKLIEISNREISQTILGQTATTEGTPGKLGEEKGQNETKEDIVEADKRLVKQTFNQLFRWITALNFSGAEPPEFVFFEEEDIRRDRAERDKVLTEQGVRFTPAYYRRTYNLEEEDFTVGEPPAKAPQTEGRQFTETSGNRATEEDAVDIAAQGAKASQEAISALLAPVLEKIEKARTLEEIGEEIYGFYPGLDTALFQELLAQAQFAAGLAGYAAAEGDAE